ncbi:MAG: mycofactocin-coupled SDR family oxidoreductase [Acidimicrobiia bacterium]
MSVASTGRVEGKVAFITGGAHGQGRSHALLLAEQGADIVVIDACSPMPGVPYPMGTAEDLATTVRLVEERDRRCLSFVADVRDFSALRAAADATAAEFGHIDIVAVNHGVITFNYFEEIPEQAWDTVLDVNVKGVWNTVRAVAPHMKAAERGGSIVITSSMAGLRGHAAYSHYVASKHAVTGLAKSLANELAPYRIRVNTVHPTGVAVDFTGRESDSFMGTRSFEGADPRIAEDPLMALNAMNRLPDHQAPFEDSTPVVMLEPIDISNAVLFLASDESRYITGVQLPVDAGCNVKP